MSIYIKYYIHIPFPLPLTYIIFLITSDLRAILYLYRPFLKCQNDILSLVTQHLCDFRQELAYLLRKYEEKDSFAAIYLLKSGRVVFLDLKNIHFDFLFVFLY